MYARDAFCSWAWVEASFGGSRRIRSYCRARSRRPRSSANASASTSSPTSTPFSSALRARELQCRARRVDARDRRRAAARGDHAERPGVGEHVEHPAARGEQFDGPAGVALVEVEARLVAVGRVDGEAPATLVGDEVGADRITAHQSAPLGESLAAAGVGVAALVHGDDAGERGQRVEHRVAPTLGAGRRQLADHRVAVSVGDHAGHPVGLGEHQPGRVRAAGEQVGPPRRGGRDASRRSARHRRASSSKVHIRARICDAGL